MVTTDTSSIELRVNLNGKVIGSTAEMRSGLDLMRLPPLHPSQLI